MVTVDAGSRKIKDKRNMRVKTEERRQAIVDTAQVLFTKKGFAQTSMSEIAKQVGGSKATLYNYFKSKEEIFAAVMEISAAKAVSISTVLEGLSVEKPLQETLVAFGVEYLKFIMKPEILAVHKMALLDAGRSEIGRYFYEAGPERGWRNVQEFFDKQVEKGQLVVDDTWMAALQFKALLEAELLFPYMLGVIEMPADQQLERVIRRAVLAFCRLYHA